MSTSIADTLQGARQVSEPLWLALDLVLDIHAEQLALFGGADGLRDSGLLESALGAAAEQMGLRRAPILPTLAAAYAFGLARNHPFVDGNKRAAFARHHRRFWA